MSQEHPHSSSTPEQLAMGKLKVIDQGEEYRREMGDAAYQRQKRLADLEKGLCVCSPQKVKWRWEGSPKPITRTVHRGDCPKWKPWMGER